MSDNQADQVNTGADIAQHLRPTGPPTREDVKNTRDLPDPELSLTQCLVEVRIAAAALEVHGESELLKAAILDRLNRGIKTADEALIRTRGVSISLFTQTDSG